MEKQEQLNNLESRQLELQARIRRSDRAALDYVKTLPGFREAYPEFAADFDEAASEEAATQEAATELRADWAFHIGEWVNAGDEIVYNGRIYVVLQAHALQADWVPDQVPALYRLKGDAPSGDDDQPVNEWPDWVQPTGAHDAYNQGDKVTYNGHHYISLINANTWSPEAYPAGWQLAD